MSNFWESCIICSLIFKKWHRFCRARICRFIFSPARNISPRVVTRPLPTLPSSLTADKKAPSLMTCILMRCLETSAPRSPAPPCTIHTGFRGRWPIGFPDAVCLQDGIMTHVLASRPKRYIFVVDMQGFSQYHIGGQARKCARRLSAVISEYYPNLIDRTEVVNAPLLFAGIWAFVRPFMPKDFAESLCLVRTGDVDLGEIREIGGQADMAWRL